MSKWKSKLNLCVRTLILIIRPYLRVKRSDFHPNCMQSFSIISIRSVYPGQGDTLHHHFRGQCAFYSATWRLYHLKYSLRRVSSYNVSLRDFL